jgi:hypothetical protein
MPSAAAIVEALPIIFSLIVIEGCFRWTMPWRSLRWLRTFPRSNSNTKSSLLLDF